MITMIRQGGIRMPIAEDAEMIATARSGLKPMRISDGTISEPMAETSATVEPEIPEKNISATTTVMPIPRADVR